MPVNELIAQRFKELEEQAGQLVHTKDEAGIGRFPRILFQEWRTSSQNLIEIVFGVDSAHSRNFREIYEGFDYSQRKVDELRGIFAAAKTDYEGGYFNLEQTASGEILGDFVKLANASLQDGYKDVAAVLACAALEDALKRYARENNLEVDDKVMQEVVGALKSKGLVKGAQKSLLNTMPKLRDYAMHANWDELASEDVSSIIGFVEQFLLSHF